MNNNCNNCNNCKYCKYCNSLSSNNKYVCYLESYLVKYISKSVELEYENEKLKKDNEILNKFFVENKKIKSDNKILNKFLENIFSLVDDTYISLLDEDMLEDGVDNV